MDYSDNTAKASSMYSQRGVDFLMAYSRADLNSPFFDKYFPNYHGKVISVPFGYGKRFKCEIPFEKRENKCIALGSVNPVRDPLMAEESLKEYISYYATEEYSHPIRRAIVENLNMWQDCISSRLPVFPETKNPKYDAVKELNNYTMFINDASIDNFPPARTYEGIASGSVMVAEDLQIYRDLGFINGENCILFEHRDYDQMIQKIRYYMQNPEELMAIQKKSITLSKKFSHVNVAKELYDRIRDIAIRKNFNSKKIEI